MGLRRALQWRPSGLLGRSSARPYTRLATNGAARLIDSQLRQQTEHPWTCVPHREARKLSFDICSTSKQTPAKASFSIKYDSVHPPKEVLHAVDKSLRIKGDLQAQDSPANLMNAMLKVFKEHEAEQLSFSIDHANGRSQIILEEMLVDTDALGRHADLVELVADTGLSKLETLAKQQKLIYTELNGDIGCIVNGAGLAMATNDILTEFGGKAANFLDTGGQATTDLLVKAFELLLADGRVQAILVNIFGGVIRCDLIAESVIRAAKELDLSGIPIVIRLRGTNYEKGQRMIADSGLDLFPCNEIEDAAHQVIKLAREGRRKTSNHKSLPFPSKGARRLYSTDRRDRLRSLNLDSSTRVIYQGFTGSVATANAKATIGFGTNVVGGVSPGKGGSTHLGLPVYDSVDAAVEALEPDATAIFVPAYRAKSAILDAIRAEIPIIVSVAEGIPVHDMLEIHEALERSGRSRLIGPNCPGIIVPEARVRIGIMPYEQFSPGRIGIISKSGTLSYEAVAETTKHGLGQSVVVGIGGDLLPGTTMTEALAAILPRPDTRGLILIGEIGGEMEIAAARWLERNNVDGKPIVGMVAGHTAPVDRVMGHAGACRRAGEPSAQEKSDVLAKSGVHMVKHTGQLGKRMKELLSATTFSSK